jgi:hypothetical protein
MNYNDSVLAALTVDRESDSRRAKAAKLRALASLAMAPEKLRSMANSLGRIGADHDAQGLEVLAARIAKAFDEAHVPELEI